MTGPKANKSGACRECGGRLAKFDAGRAWVCEKCGAANDKYRRLNEALARSSLGQFHRSPEFREAARKMNTEFNAKLKAAGLEPLDSPNFYGTVFDFLRTEFGYGEEEIGHMNLARLEPILDRYLKTMSQTPQTKPTSGREEKNNPEPKALQDLFFSDQNLAFGNALLANRKLLERPKGKRNLTLCKWVDDKCETPLPDGWAPKNGGTTWADAYKDDDLRPRIHSMIDYVMGKMINEKLLPCPPTVQ